MEEQVFNVLITEETNKRLQPLVNDLCRLIRERTENPIEALITIDAVRRHIEESNGMAIMAPLDLQIGHT